MNVPSLFISFNTFFFTIILLSSVFSMICLSLDFRVFCYVFRLCFHNKYCSNNFLSRQTDWLVPRSLRMKSGNIANFKNTYFDKYLRTAGSDSSYILQRKLNKIIQEPDWPSRLSFCFFWNIKSLYFTYSYSYSFDLSLPVIHCH